MTDQILGPFEPQKVPLTFTNGDGTKVVVGEADIHADGTATVEVSDPRIVAMLGGGVRQRYSTVNYVESGEIAEVTFGEG